MWNFFPPLQPSTELEREVAAILGKSESNLEKEGEELTEAEKNSLFEMTVEEVCVCVSAVLAMTMIFLSPPPGKGENESTAKAQSTSVLL